MNAITSLLHLRKRGYAMQKNAVGKTELVETEDAIQAVLPEEYQMNLSDFALDTPILKSGKETRYKQLPSTAIIFITRDDIFGKDLAMYTFSERCEEVPELSLEDGTSKMFLNMTSRNGRPELISLLQYMRNTTLDNSDIIVKDERILHLDKIVGEVKQSEEWEAVKMNILEIGLAQGIERGMQIGIEQGIEQGIQRGTEIGSFQTLIRNVESAMKNFNIDLRQACEGLGASVEEYERAKELAARQEK